MSSSLVRKADFDYVVRLVREHTGIVLDAGKEYLVDSRLRPILKRLGFNDLGQLVESLRDTRFDHAHHAVVDAMATHETSFFRDPKFFATLRDAVLPALIAKRERERRLRIWCAASSSGQEPYSVLFMLREQFPQLANWRVQVVATDFSREMQARTREGRYTQMEINRGLPARTLVRFFDRQGLEWQVKPEVRAALEVCEVNLVQPWQGLGDLDIVLLRNVLIYFDQDTKREVMARVHAALRPDGFLFLGSAEAPCLGDTSFKRSQDEHANCFQPVATRAATRPRPSGAAATPLRPIRTPAPPRP